MSNTATATNEPCPFCGATETNPECVNCRLGAYLTGEASDYSPEHYGITTLYGFSSANAYDEPAWFYTREAAARFADACGAGWAIEETNAANVNPGDVMDTADQPWTKEGATR